jgi:hypothetical protein
MSFQRELFSPDSSDYFFLHEENKYKKSNSGLSILTMAKTYYELVYPIISNKDFHELFDTDNCICDGRTYDKRTITHFKLKSEILEKINALQLSEDHLPLDIEVVPSQEPVNRTGYHALEINITNRTTPKNDNGIMLTGSVSWESGDEFQLLVNVKLIPNTSKYVGTFERFVFEDMSGIKYMHTPIANHFSFLNDRPDVLSDSASYSVEDIDYFIDHYHDKASELYKDGFKKPGLKYYDRCIGITTSGSSTNELFYELGNLTVGTLFAACTSTMVDTGDLYNLYPSAFISTTTEVRERYRDLITEVQSMYDVQILANVVEVYERVLETHDIGVQYKNVITSIECIRERELSLILAGLRSMFENNYLSDHISKEQYEMVHFKKDAHISREDVVKITHHRTVKDGRGGYVNHLLIEVKYQNTVKDEDFNFIFSSKDTPLSEIDLTTVHTALKYENKNYLSTALRARKIEDLYEDPIIPNVQRTIAAVICPDIIRNKIEECIKSSTASNVTTNVRSNCIALPSKIIIKPRGTGEDTCEELSHTCWSD